MSTSGNQPQNFAVILHGKASHSDNVSIGLTVRYGQMENTGRAAVVSLLHDKLSR